MNQEDPIGPDTESCPRCKASWRAGEIPEEHRPHFGDKTHFSRLIGIYDIHTDRTVRWRCPDCEAEFPRY